MSVDSRSEEEGEVEDGGEDVVTKNPIGEFQGSRNDKNERHGRGRALLPNGDVYLGCYYRGKRHGMGIYRYRNGNGARYGGDWVMGQKQGWGTFYYPDGSQYTGHWDRDDRHGWGVYVFPNGDEYEGWWYRGRRNGRGIYRTKKTGEKFVGNWTLGKRQGPGMIIRQHHRYIGNWFNDIPRGAGVYIFPDTACEQHGTCTHLKILPGSEERWTLLGYQVRLMRGAPPPLDPVLIERERADFLSRRAGGEYAGEDYGGEGYGRPRRIRGPGAEYEGEDFGGGGDWGRMTNPAQDLDQVLYEYMKSVVGSEGEADEVRIPVVSMWRVTKFTGLITPYPDETVPPPPMPPTPQPPPEPEQELLTALSDADKAASEHEDPITVARRLAKTHKLGPAYLGSGVCQLSETDIRAAEGQSPYSRFSDMSLSGIEQMRALLDATGTQLEPLDVEAAMRTGNYLAKHGMDVADRWRNCLSSDANCESPEGTTGPDAPETTSTGRGSLSSSTTAPRRSLPTGEQGGDEMTPATVDTEEEAFPQTDYDEEPTTFVSDAEDEAEYDSYPDY